MDTLKSADGDKMMGDQSLDVATGTVGPKLSDFPEKEDKEVCEVTKEEAAGNTDGERNSLLPNESQCSDEESSFLLDDNGYKLCSTGEPSEFDKIIAAIEDSMIDDDIGQLQLGFVDQYHQLNNETNHADKTSEQIQLFEEYKAIMIASIDTSVKKVVSEYSTVNFMEKIFSTEQSTDFEESEVYELLKTMYDLEAFEALVADYVVLVNSQDVFSAVKVLPLDFL